MSFNFLGLSDELIRTVSERGYKKPTPIQQQAIPVILEGHDVVGSGQTGTGKTAGFTLPILHRLSKKTRGKGFNPVRALILVPTRELAVQVDESIKTYGKYLSLKSTAIFGGVKLHPQILKLRRGMADILVATPGRLLDHINQKTIDLSKVDTVVLDEADRMLDMGFIHDIRKILSALPQERQNLLFSATIFEGIQKLIDNMLNSPIMIEVACRNMEAENIEQVIHPVNRHNKQQLLLHLIHSQSWQQALVFTRTKYGADRLTKQLKNHGISATAIHGDKSQGQRMQALENFKNSRVNILVATDIAARGLDIDQLPYVVNFDLPHVPEDYIHRIGRTGRAGCKGQALSLVSNHEKRMLKNIERLIKRKLPQVVISDYESNLPPLKLNCTNRKKDSDNHHFSDKKRSKSSCEKTYASSKRKNKSNASGKKTLNKKPKNRFRGKWNPFGKRKRIKKNKRG